ncbi:ATP synthase F1 subunit gamma [Blattabacterium sp. (Blattella germanica) str. Bge]|uniref:ATP synthase F1 subunit gamma n=1 Tax=Blattabacterium sp. (Blattella germanica) TaxID=624186 RepID=UPI0001BB6268|nr:ATP synthase F1 subunit gamma [Blattabacterium sp. (Blattella germanica)]ACY40562.1 ATP synthase F1 subunit gamma [Blattabacterium sp. (Blattella germanica) str. Bge]
MSNPKEIKRRILSIESVIKTTEAMKMISIVKLRKTKGLLTHVKTYLDHIELLISDFLLTEKLEKNKYFLEKEEKKKLFIVFTSNRGLCGSFNSLIFEKINQLFQKKGYSHNECIFFSIGKKGFDFLVKRYKIYDKNNNWIDWGDDFTKSNEKIQTLTKKFISIFIQKKVSSIYLMYNNFKKSLFQEIIVEKLLPVSVDLQKEKTEIEYILEPSQKEIFDYLIPKFVNAKLLKIFLESSYSEHTARMISMHKATENASEIKNDLVLNYNKERQTTITKEILEIISGLESLNEKK